MKCFNKYSRTQKNIFFSIIQVIINGLSLFIAYRINISIVGTEIFGVWAIINSFASFLSITNFGINGAFVRYIPTYIIEKREVEIAALVFTNVLFFLLFGVFLGGIIFFISDKIIPFIIDTKYILIAYPILKLSIVVFITNVAVGLFSSILDGHNLIFLRNIVQIIGSLVFVILNYFFINYWGIIGMVWGQLFQAVISLTILLIICYHIINGKYHWNFKYIKETFTYGLQSQIISFMQIGYEPVIKILLGKYGGISSVSYFELSNKVVLQVKGIISSAFQYLVPLFASINGEKELRDLYNRTNKKILIVSLCSFSILIISSPLISFFFFKKIDLQYIQFIIIISLSWTVNCISLTSYYYNIGKGLLMNNITFHFLLIFINLSLIYFFIELDFVNLTILLSFLLSHIFSSIFLIRKYKQLNH